MVKRIILICFGIFLFVAICFFQKTTVHNSRVTPEKEAVPYWVDNLLKNPTCQPPCWENIIPGETLIGAVPEMVKKIPGSSNITGPTRVYGLPNLLDVRIGWWLSKGIIEKGYMGLAYAHGVYEPVSMLFLQISGGVKTDVYISKLLSTYGEPDYFQTYYCDGTFCNFRLIFPDRGMVIEVLLHDQGGKSSIDEKSCASAIILIPSGLESYSTNLLWPTPNTVNPIIEWKGYGTYYPDGTFDKDL